MFTGIIEELGVIRKITTAEIVVTAAKVLTDVKIGDSVAVNGVCLTVTAFDSQSFRVNVMEETLKKTTLGQLNPGVKVNLERALRLTDRLGGHLVSGHVDGLGVITKIEALPHSTLMTLTPPAELLPFIAAKGSITIDGVSLTVVDVERDFTVSLVRHTQEITNLGFKKAADTVNLEVDLVARYVQKLLTGSAQQSPAGTSVEKLFRAGFIS